MPSQLVGCSALFVSFVCCCCETQISYTFRIISHSRFSPLPVYILPHLSYALHVSGFLCIIELLLYFLDCHFALEPHFAVR
jgi:hypothetical protein